MLGKSALRVYFVGLPCDIRMKISEILDHSDHLHTHVEEKKMSIVTTLAHILRISIGEL